MQDPIDVQEWFGGIDIYLFDQVLKGRIVPGMRLLDAGCGSGRNLVYFLRSGYEVFAVDESASQITQIRQMASALAPHLPVENFRVEPVEKMSWASAGLSADSTDFKRRLDLKQPAISGEAGFDFVLSSAVLHFASDEQQWQAMVNEMWRVLRPGGIFFARLASIIGIENRVRLIEGRRYHLPDGSDRFLVDEVMLHQVTSALGAEFLEPIKTTVVENMRSMTTWVLRKSRG